MNATFVLKDAGLSPPSTNCGRPPASVAFAGTAAWAATAPVHVQRPSAGKRTGPGGRHGTLRTTARMSQKRIHANDGIISPAGKTALEEAGFTVTTEAIPRDQLAAYLNKERIEVLLVRSATKVRKDLIDACPGCVSAAEAWAWTTSMWNTAVARASTSSTRPPAQASASPNW